MIAEYLVKLEAVVFADSPEEARSKALEIGTEPKLPPDNIMEYGVPYVVEVNR